MYVDLILVSKGDLIKLVKKIEEAQELPEWDLIDDVKDTLNTWIYSPKNVVGRTIS